MIPDRRCQYEMERLAREAARHQGTVFGNVAIVTLGACLFLMLLNRERGQEQGREWRR